MNTDLGPAALARLLQLASPALPVGAFSYSQGLESAIDAGSVHDSLSAQRWIADHLELVLARYEAPVYAQAHALWHAKDVAQLTALNTTFVATRESSEPRAETLQVGYAYTAWIRQVPELSESERARLDDLLGNTQLSAPVAAAIAAASLRLDVRAGLTGYLFGFLENQVMVLAKALPLGQIAGQRLLLRLASKLNRVVDRVLALPEEEQATAAPMLAILSMQHETQYSRLFRS
ncbi:MAG: urease accessory protein UreF [Casimicrobiaceae bacterium]|nr:urease accessory protein UreF [Casimicrobiaceae bacterium]MCX8098706.1 urease accessory protein UreF [Casimicrobiaceae bacterium]MDW8312145.1 urease accessory UreF family protein [Burkholderiales bacterium]